MKADDYTSQPSSSSAALSYTAFLQKTFQLKHWRESFSGKVEVL